MQTLQIPGRLWDELCEGIFRQAIIHVYFVWYFLIILILALRVVLHFKYYQVSPFGINISCPCFPLPLTKKSHDNIPKKWDSGFLIFMWSDLKLNTLCEGGALFFWDKFHFMTNSSHWPAGGAARKRDRSWHLREVGRLNAIKHKDDAWPLGGLQGKEWHMNWFHKNLKRLPMCSASPGWSVKEMRCGLLGVSHLWE